MRRLGLAATVTPGNHARAIWHKAADWLPPLGNSEPLCAQPARMILMILAAVLGAALGMSLRPALLATAASVGLAGSIQGLAVLVMRLVVTPSELPGLADRLRFWLGTDPASISAVLAAAGIGSLVSAVLWSTVNRQSTDHYWFGRGRKSLRRFRALEIVEDRDLHDIAEARFRDILGR